MKKIKKLIGMLVMFIIMVCTVSACVGDKEISNLQIKDGTIRYTYLQGSEVSFDDLVVIVYYNDGTKEEVTSDKVTISEFNTTTAGTYKVTITYEKKSIEVDLKVTNVQDEAYGINGVELPESILTNINNKKEQENKETEFYDRDEIYVVGDDNPFKFLPNITSLDEDDQLLTINSYRSISKVSMKETSTGTYNELTDSNVATYVAIDENNSTYDFTNAAVGKFFKLEVRPYYLSEEQLLDVETYTVTVEFQVVDAYNITNAKELGIIANRSDYGGKNDVENMNTFLANNNITKPSVLNGIVLQNNITITEDDLPEQYFETQDGQKRLRDYIDIYHHATEKNATFTIYGNYFTIDASNLPLVIDNEHGNDDKFSQSALFKFSMFGTSAEVDENNQTTNTTIKNISFIGNGNRSNNEEGFLSLILFKAKRHIVTLDNAIVKTFLINLFAEFDYGTLNVNHVKSYDAYQNSLFVWAEHSFSNPDTLENRAPVTVNITNSEFSRSGGPIMINQHKEPTTTENEKSGPIVNIDANTVLSNNLGGNEAWFVGVEATTTAGMIAALSPLIEGYATAASAGKASFVNDEGKMNIISLNMRDGLVGGAGAKGVVNIGGSEIMNLEITNPLIQGPLSQGAPVFVSSDGGIACAVPNGGAGYTLTILSNESGALYTGKYLTLYYGGMGVVLEYLH